jgi:hypothetical protein
MNIKDLLNNDADLKGVEVTGNVLRVFAPKTKTGKFGEYSTQMVVLEEDGSEILITLYNKEIDKKTIGKPITITGCNLNHYEDKEGTARSVLDTTKASSVVYAGGETASTTPKKTEEATPDGLTATVKDCFVAAHDVLSDTVITGLMKNVCGEATNWTSEDLRSLAISLFIQNSRR